MSSLTRALLKRLIPRKPLFSLRLACASAGVQGVLLRVPAESPLYQAAGGELVELPLDDVISPYVMEHGQWQTEELEFLSQHLPNGRCVLVDLGANIGLITRQLLHRLHNVVAAVCYEPHPGNFRMLQRNLGHLPKAVLIQAAMARDEGELRFYEEVQNAGNYSLNEDAMRGKEYRTSVVRCVAASEQEILGHLPHELRALPLLWKSDTQGYDETIMCSLPDSFWGRVHAGVMEMWRIDRPAFDRARLGHILSGFTVRRFSHDPARNLSVEEILEYSAGSDYGHADVFFARG